MNGRFPAPSLERGRPLTPKTLLSCDGIYRRVLLRGRRDCRASRRRGFKLRKWKKKRNPLKRFLKNARSPIKVSPKRQDLDESMENVILAPETALSRFAGDLRAIVIDGCNVGRAYSEALGSNSFFLWRGVELCVEFFRRRGHEDIFVFLPHNRAQKGPDENRRVLDSFKRDGVLVLTPATQRQSYDDRYIVQYAAIHGGIIVSNDNYKDLLGESSNMNDAITNRLLKFNFVGKSTLMFPVDPLGKGGLTLKDFLKF